VPSQFPQTEDQSVSPADLETCTKVLELLDRGIGISEDVSTIEELISRLQRKIRKRIRKASFAEKSFEDQKAKRDTVRVQNAAEDSMVGKSMLQTESPISAKKLLQRPANCHVCNGSYREVHFHYHRLCPECAELNYAKREIRSDLSERRALVTGARIKIGYQTALRLLRSGAQVIATTRFPRDAAVRYAQEPDFEKWQNRLTIHHLDFRNIPALISWAEQFRDNEDPIDILINNAAQTIWRTPEYYEKQNTLEQQPLKNLPNHAQALLANNQSLERIGHNASTELIEQKIPTSELAQAFREPVDKRNITSWDLRLHEVEPLEFLEVQLINVTAPFILTSTLKAMLMKSPIEKRFVVNVSGKDGRFAVDEKANRHPHVNMSKAAMNMMTRSSADDFSANNIFMNSVDTGWVTLEGGYARTQKIKEDGFVPPLDAIDAAARICDPIEIGIEAEPEFGKLFKDYKPADW